MVGRGVLASAAVLAVCLPAVTMAARVPAWRPIAPPRLGIRFDLAADWAIDTKWSLDNGWKWAAYSPGRIAWVRISTTTTTLDSTQLGHVFVERLRPSVKQAVQGDPLGYFRTADTKVGGVPAVKLTIHDRGVTVLGVAEGTTIEYVLAHAGVAYVLEFDATDPFFERFRPAFDHLVSSLRFTQVA